MHKSLRTLSVRAGSKQCNLVDPSAADRRPNRSITDILYTISQRTSSNSSTLGDCWPLHIANCCGAGRNKGAGSSPIPFSRSFISFRSSEPSDSYTRRSPTLLPPTSFSLFSWRHHEKSKIFISKHYNFWMMYLFLIPSTPVCSTWRDEQNYTPLLYILKIFYFLVVIYVY